MNNEKEIITGLTDEEVEAARLKYGSNVLVFKKQNEIVLMIRELIQEPMIVLLIVTSAIYWISGDTGDAVFLIIALLFTVAISIYQDKRSKNALEKLKEFTQPKCKVIRNGSTQFINSSELVVGDSMVVEEGNLINADGIIIQSNDFSVNESILTGESLSVAKDPHSDTPLVFKGTTVTSGLAIVKITATGNASQLGKIGKSLESIEKEKTPLENQISRFVQKMVFIGSIVFIIVWILNYLKSKNILDSLLKALALAMSIIPEEIPVAFTTFMALGAWRLMKMGVVVKQMKTVETLGSASIICTDKTGTITENTMKLAQIFTLKTGSINITGIPQNIEEKELIRIAMFASEPIPFDPMEVALHQSYADNYAEDERANFTIIHEYPLEGKPPIMTHIFEDHNKRRIIAAKGAPEAFIKISNLSSAEKKLLHETIENLAGYGYRILGVAEAEFDGYDFPDTQQEFRFNFKGLVAFYDPPKQNIDAVLNSFYKAGIKVKIVTGDNVLTTTAIARQIKFDGYDKCISGDELMELKADELNNAVIKNNVFTRMFPDAKLKIIEALKAHHEIVAMTGDGVNDGPALKAAHIGIAMGKKGSEIARQAASLILVNDDFSKMVDAVAMGRKIYTNLKKAIQYIISIHIPIILTVFIPLALGWKYPTIFTPVHVIFLELIMGPTCSIIYENEPIEANAMLQKPRPISNTFFNWRELITSIIQGLVITCGSMVSYNFAVNHNWSETETRSMVFITLIAANICLTLVNRSFYYSFITTLKYKNNLVSFIIVLTILITITLLYIPPFAHFFLFTPLNSNQVIISSSIGIISVMWFEIVKLLKRNKKVESEKNTVV